MDYEKAYKEALERAKGIHSFSSDVAEIKRMEQIFPELAESEDEKIRKSIIAILNNYVDNSNTFKSKMLAWLEKQGEEDSSIQQAYKQGYIEGQRIERKCWLENQSEKPHGKTALEAAKEISPVESLGISPEKYEEIVNECIYGESADKVEPKFHEGDWVVDKQGIVHQIANVVENFTNHTYGYDVVGDGYFNDNTEGVRLWTIKDAKPGDVLASGHLVFIFKVIHGVWLNCHCSAHNDGSFIADSYDLLTNKYFSEVHPATKEQRDLLFAKMREEGYTFDFDKKELKKIEQKLSNSAKIGKNDTLLDLLQKIPSCITVDGIDYHFVMKKTVIYMAYYEGEGEGCVKTIFWTAGDPVDILTEMLEKLKKEGLLE